MTTELERLSLLAGLVVWTVALAGCGPDAGTNPATEADAIASMPTEPDITKVIVIVKDRYTCWLYTEDKARVHGIYISGLYLIGPEGKGVFGDGVIKPRLYVIEKDDHGKRTPRLVKEWSFTVAEALQWRAKKQTMLGHGYALPLFWGDVPLEGKEVRVVVGFQRPDGNIISSSKMDAMVPTGAG